MVELTHHWLEGSQRLALPPRTAIAATGPTLGSPAGVGFVPGNPANSVLSPEEVFDERYFRQVYGASSGQDEPSQTLIDRARDRLLARLARRYCAKPLNQSDVVDVGCGYGWLLDAFDDAHSVAGSDISPHAIAMARARRPNRSYRIADLQDGPDFGQTFDVVLAVNLLEHLDRPEDGVGSLRTLCHRGSVVLVHLPVVDNALSRLIYFRTYASDPTHIFRPTGPTVRALFEERGFTLLRASYLPHVAPRLTRHLRLHPSHLAIFRMDA